MQLEIQARQIELTDILQAHVKRRLEFALGTRFDQIQRINVMLSDINGPRGGNDKRCQLIISMAGQPNVVIEDVQAHLKVAIDRAASRASRTVTRRLSKHRIKATRVSAMPSHVSEQQSASL